MKFQFNRFFYANLFFLLINANVFCQNSSINNAIFDDFFNENLTEQEKNQLKEKKVVIKNIGRFSKISIQDKNDSTNKLFNELKSLNPNYLAEIIKIVPQEKNKNITKNLENILSDIPSYKGIPYYSEHNDIWVDLYSDAKIISKTNSAQDKNQQIAAHFFMEPFGEINSDILIEFSQNELFYSNTNSTPIKYNGIVCVNKKNMRSFITVFSDDENWILYGIGGVNAPRIPFLTKRIELSFMNRIKTFCNFVFDKLDQGR